MRHITKVNNLIIKILETACDYLKSSNYTQNYVFQKFRRRDGLIKAVNELIIVVQSKYVESEINFLIINNYNYSPRMILWSFETPYKVFLDQRRYFHINREFFAKDGNENLSVQNEEKNEDGNISREDIQLLDKALTILTRNKTLREEVEELKKKLQIVDEKVEEIKEGKVANLLYKKLNSMVDQLDKDLRDLEKKEEISVGVRKKYNYDQTVVKNIELEEDCIQITEVVKTVKGLQKIPNEKQVKTLENLLNRIDMNQDGQAKVADIIKIIDAIDTDI